MFGRLKQAAGASDSAAKLEALGKSLAIIEFAMDGTILDANPNFLALLGYELDDVKGKHHAMFVTQDDLDSRAYKEFWRALRRGQFQSAEYKRIGRGRREIWIQATYNPVLNGRGEPVKIVKFASDVTAQKLTAADFSGQIDAIAKSQAVIHFDMDGHILDANANFLDAMGYKLDELRGQHHKIFVDPATAAGWEYADFWNG